MIQRLKEIANRPVSELPAGLVLAVCVALIVLGSVAIAQISDPDTSLPTRHAQDTGSELEGREIDINPPVVSHDQRPPSEHENPEFPREYPATSQDDEHARAGARRFMRGYLAYQYGHGDADEITNLTRELLADLQQHPPRVPDRVRDRRARLVLVRLDDPADTGDGTRVVTLVDDGVTRYTVHLRVIQTGFEQWSVAEVGDV